MQLDDISSPKDIKNLSYDELRHLAADIRKRIIEVTSKNGGHVASNLGAVELTLMLHKVFNSPEDAIIWDVSHQSYTHKILTGRNAELDTLRLKDGISGFTRHTESEHDLFDAGHASTSISQGLGLLMSRKLQNQRGKVIAVLGDGALTGGMAFEALSHAGQSAKDLIVILNDNRMSISANTGSLSRYLSRLTMSSEYQGFRRVFDRLVEKLPGGPFFTKCIYRFKRGIKGIFFPDTLFADLGFEYVGPLNGHNIEELDVVLNRVKKLHRPVVVHVTTKKGKGYKPAEENPSRFHGVGPYNPETGELKITPASTPTFTSVFGNTVCQLADENPKICAITAAMTQGTGLTDFSRKYPDRFFDVGIAEEHAVTFAGGLARGGMKPVVAIYSTFMQRSVDQLIHDIALQKVSAVFVLDRSGAVPDDGETHQGIFDISLFRPIPDVSLLAPATGKELQLMLSWAVQQDFPVVIRYPKGPCPQEQDLFSKSIQQGRGVLIPGRGPNGNHHHTENLFVCTGGIFPEVAEATRSLAEQGILCDIYNLRFLKPLDKSYFVALSSQYSRIVFVEDGIRIGGIGTYLESLLIRSGQPKQTAVCGFPDRFIAQGKRSEILEDAHLSPAHLERKMKELLR